MPLDTYHAKRKFDQTPEPQGGQGSGRLRFVVQKHEASRLHYDFRLEMDGILKSWAIPKGPSLNPHDKHLAVMTEDHPYDYRTFEGTIPKGNYGAGTVMVWDEGTYEPLAWDEKTGKTLELSREEQDKLAQEAVAKGHITFIMHGTKLNGEFALIKMHHAEDDAWLLVKADKDSYVSTDDITHQDRSAITGRTMGEIAEGKPETTLNVDLTAAPSTKLPTTFKPMLATLSDTTFDAPDWLYEIKWDGYRIMAEVRPDGVTLHSRGGQDYTEQFKAVADELHKLQLPAVIDGEMTIVDDDGKSSFQALQNYLHTGQGHLVYFAFDLIHLDGHDLTKLPLTDRKDLLRRALPGADHLKYSDHIVGQGKALLASARTQGIEGIIAKRADSLYLPSQRSRSWLKFKLHHRQEAVIIGYTWPRAGRQHFGALVLGIYEADKLIYAGHTGSGFTDAVLEDIYNRLQPLKTTAAPITPVPKTNEPATWVKPQLVCEIEFTEWTDDGSMRHPIFLGIREDKPAKDVHRETTVKSEDVISLAKGESKVKPHRQSSAGSVAPPDEAKKQRSLDRDEALPQKNARRTGSDKVKLTHLDKLYWPKEGITKGQLIAYYDEIAPTILPYLKDRPQSLKRFPNGATGENFFQKDMDGKAPDWARTINIHSESEDRDLEYLLCQDEATLLYMANLGCIDINPWNSRTSSLDKPDWCVIDLDPEGVDFDAVITTARTVHDVLDELKVTSYPKTSGASGLHIYIPMGARYNYDQVRLFAQVVARLTHQRLPDLTSLERSPAKRPNKVYLDYLQNRRGQTLASVYCVRPEPKASVSTPLDWDEVKAGLHPTNFTLHNTPARLRSLGDLWQPVLGPGIDLTTILRNSQ